MIIILLLMLLYFLQRKVDDPGRIKNSSTTANNQPTINNQHYKIVRKKFYSAKCNLILTISGKLPVLIGGPQPPTPHET